MTDIEYKELQNFCDRKVKEGRTRFSGSKNREDGWKEAFLSMKSYLSRTYGNVKEDRK